MPPLGDDPDQQSAQDWGLGPPIRGHFGKSVLQMVSWVGGAYVVLLVLVDVYLGQDDPFLLPVGLGIGIPLCSALVWLNTALGCAALVQVGTKGVSTCNRRFFGGGLRRYRWIPWNDVVLDLPGFGYRFARTLGLKPRTDPASIILIDYAQARAILDRPESAVIRKDFPSWLAERLGTA
jgi:hypothetical protein